MTLAPPNGRGENMAVMRIGKYKRRYQGFVTADDGVKTVGIHQRTGARDASWVYLALI